jgi:hypothetical protein
MIKNTIKNVVIFLLVVFIIVLFILIYLSDKQNISVEQHLHKIHSNKKILKQRFPSFMNPEMKVNHVNNIIVIDDFLNKDYFEFLKNQFNGKKYKPINTLLRKASGFDFFKLHESSEYFGFIELYYTNDFLDVISDVLKKPVQRVQLSDPNAASLLIYTNPGDKLEWHYDFSRIFYTRYVVLLTIVNENQDQTDLSQNEFHYMFNEKEHKIKMKPNSLTIFEGDKIMHRASPISTNERRILMSFVLCDICNEKKSLMYFIYEKIKSMVLYNV